MTYSNNEFLLILVGLVVIGMTALLLVANELGRRSGLHVVGRIALAGGLGLGVLAFSIKAGIAFYLNRLEPADIAGLSEKAEPAAWQGGDIDGSVASDLWRWQALPLVPPVPADARSGEAWVTLGKRLFFDTRLSADDTLSCASCHKLGEGGDDNAAFSTGIKGQKGDRNAPSVLNAAFLKRLFWDGRAASLEEQARGPLVNPKEMGMPSLAAVERKLQAIPEYQHSFATLPAGPQPLSIDNVVRAIAAFERTLVTPDTPYDRFVRGDDYALTPQQLRGMALFEDMGCRHCHIDPTFSSAGLVKPLGVYRPFPLYPDHPLLRKYDLLVDGRASSYRVPSLRNVARTAPYFHNGAVDTLEEAIRIMAVAQLDKKLSDKASDDILVTWPEGSAARMLTITRNRAVSEEEVADIAAFLGALSGDPKPMERQ